jgi:hypothetical protein
MKHNHLLTTGYNGIQTTITAIQTGGALTVVRGKRLLPPATLVINQLHQHVWRQTPKSVAFIPFLFGRPMG